MSGIDLGVCKVAARAIASGDVEKGIALLVAGGIDVRSMVMGSSAVRMRRHRARNKTSQPASQVTPDVTLSDAECDAICDALAPLPSHTLPSPSETLSQDQDLLRSSSFGSLREGSDLEGRAEDADGYPIRIEITESIRARCVAAGAPLPTDEDAATMLEDARSKGQRFPDWGARLVRWMIYEKTRRASTKPLSGTEDAAAAPLAEAYARGIAQGKGGPYALPSRELADLVATARAHGRRRSTGEALEPAVLAEWTEAAACDFAAWLVRQTDPRAVGWYGAYGPRGWARWLNEQETKREARAVP